MNAYIRLIIMILLNWTLGFADHLKMLQPCNKSQGQNRFIGLILIQIPNFEFWKSVQRLQSYS